MATRQVAAGVLVPLALLMGCGSQGGGVDARSSPRSDIGSVTTGPFGDAQIQRMSALSEVPASQVDLDHASEFDGITVYASQDQSQIFFPLMVGFCDDTSLVLEAKGDDIHLTVADSSDEHSDEVCAAGAVTHLVTVTLDEQLGRRVLTID